MTGLETYLSEMVAQRKAGVPETSFYGLLQTVLNEAGEGLKPHVKTIIHPKDSGAGIPDAGLFDENQTPDTLPAHGIVEIKPTADDLLMIANSKQVTRYVAHYGQALVTNYYQFILVTKGANGQTQFEERYNLAENETRFWTAAAQPRLLASKHEVALREYLMRVLRRNAPLAAPQDVAWILASYAREAKARIEASSVDLGALARVREQLETALGVHFEGETADEFFRSTLVQTLFYGVFSAWVLWHERGAATGTKFDLWRDTRRLNVPVVRELFEQFSAGSHLPMEVEQVLNWTAEALNRVDRPVFFERFAHGAAVQYFYEPFLEEFDPELREQLGVWYTPPEVVEYMVARVDAALRDELGMADGLADPNVTILDPCCGTGAYLVAVLRRIYRLLEGRMGAALAAQETQKAMRERVFGFEILPAPFVVAHLQLGMLLNDLHAPLAEGDRAGVYLTNALTGWGEAAAGRMKLLFPELEQERKAADAVKQERNVLVIVGNPPYSGFAGVGIDEERDLSQAYRTTTRAPAPQGQGLNDLYVRFYRMAERRIVEKTGQGVVSFISNYSWLDGLSHTGMREKYLDVFDSITIDNLNGDKYRTGKTTPDNKPDPSIFSTEFNREGIQVGTAIATLVRKPQHESANGIAFRNLWGVDKRAQLKQEASAGRQRYETVIPVVEIGLPFSPRVVRDDYLKWAKLTELFPVSFPGVQTKRDEFIIDIDKERLKARIEKYFDSRISNEEMRRISPTSMIGRSNNFDPIATREQLLKRGFRPDYIISTVYRPFDVRSMYYEQETNLLQRRVPTYYPHVKSENLFIISQQMPRRDWSMPQVIKSIGCLDLMDRGASCIPLYLYETQQPQLGLFETDAVPVNGRKPNLSDTAKAYLATVEADEKVLFYHTLAVLHSPLYRTENAGALRQDWPRVPLPKNPETLEASAELGQKVAALLDVETPVAGVTAGDPEASLRDVAKLMTVNNRAPNFTVSAGWGHFGVGSAVMPGRGRTTPTQGIPSPNPSPLRVEGNPNAAVDVYLNETTYWQNVPQAVWDYTLGGYQVLKKWLSYRETAILGRPLKAAEAVEFMNIARRIAALLALNEALDVNYLAVSVTG